MKNWDLLPKLSTLQKIELRECSISDEEFVSGFRGLKCLRSLLMEDIKSFSGIGFEDAFCDSATGNLYPIAKTLIELQVLGQCTKLKHVKGIRSLCNLQQLDLQHVPPYYSTTSNKRLLGMKEWSEESLSLTMMKMPSNNLIVEQQQQGQQQGRFHFGSELRELYLESLDLEPDCLTFLECPHLHYLRLSQISVGTLEHAQIHRGLMASCTHTLKTLIFNDGRLSCDLLNAISELQVLSCLHFQTVTFDNNEQIEKSEYFYLRPWGQNESLKKNLKDVELNRVSLTNKSGSNARLLDLFSGGFSEIETLSLSHQTCDKIKDFSFLSEMKKLKKLNLGGCALSADQLMNIFQVIANSQAPIESLYIRACEFLDDAVVFFICESFSKTLREINIGYCLHLTEACADAMCLLTKLETLTAEGVLKAFYRCSEASGKVRARFPNAEIIYDEYTMAKEP
jgi:hypothetical protein